MEITFFTIIMFFIGAGIGFAVMWGLNKATLSVLDEKLNNEQRKSAALEEKLSEFENIRVENAELKKDIESYTEKLEWLKKAEEKLREAFESLSAKALRTNAEQYMDRANEQLDKLFKQVKGDWGTQKEELKGLVNPLEKGLEKMEKQVQAIETKREGAYSGLIEQITNLSKTQEKLESAATGLTQALKGSSTRGRWGEVQLRRIVEMAGMISHVDFEEQVTAQEGRPDMIIHLPKEGIVPVDSKAPMRAYELAMETEDDDIKKQKFVEHAKAMRSHMKSLAQKSYWDKFKENTPEFVVMVVPYEGGLPVAFQSDPLLLEDAIDNKVLIVSPVTLFALLKAVSFGWLQVQLAASAREIADQGKVLYDRLVTFGSHVQNLGRHISQTTGDYNKMVGSLQSRVLPAAEKLKEMGAGSKDLPEISQIESSVKLIEE